MFSRSYAAAVYGKGEDFRLVSLDGDVVDTEAQRSAIDAGLVFCGVLHIAKDGTPSSRCEPSLDAVVCLMHAGVAFAKQTAQAELALSSSNAGWLETLYALEDPRSQV